MMYQDKKEKERAATKDSPKFVDLGTFTANLQREEEDMYLQVSISLRISKGEIEEKLSALKPEIQAKVNRILQSKKPSEISTEEGKAKLGGELKAAIEYIIGLRKIDPGSTAQTSPEQTTPSGLDDVIFPSFIIQ
jgi:flagellar FliL protein